MEPLCLFLVRSGSSCGSETPESLAEPRTAQPIGKDSDEPA